MGTLKKITLEQLAKERTTLSDIRKSSALDQEIFK